MKLTDTDAIKLPKGFFEKVDNVPKFYDWLNSLPTIDAVPVVRCKDCKHLFDGEHNANCCELLMKKAKWLTEITVDMNWYCADGERREDE